MKTCSHLPKTWETVLSLRAWNGKSPPQASQARLIIITAWKQRLSPNPFQNSVTLEALPPLPTAHDLRRLPAERAFLNCCPPSLKQKIGPFATLLTCVDSKDPISYPIYKGYLIKFSSYHYPPTTTTAYLPVTTQAIPTIPQGPHGIEYQQPMVGFKLPFLVLIFFEFLWWKDTTTTPLILQSLFSPSSYSVQSISLTLALLACLICGCLQFCHS